MINPALYSSASTEWETPDSVWYPLHQEFDFTVDAAASSHNTKLRRFWDRRDDALAQDWSSERVWCNPPYGAEQKAFVRKAAEREAEIAVLLIPARTDTRVWHECIFPYAEVRFLRGRVKFLPGVHPAPFPSAVVIFRGKSWN